mgnify:CR=1 FL=1
MLRSPFAVNKNDLCNLEYSDSSLHQIQITIQLLAAQ